VAASTRTAIAFAPVKADASTVAAVITFTVCVSTPFASTNASVNTTELPVIAKSITSTLVTPANCAADSVAAASVNFNVSVPDPPSIVSA